MVTISHKVATYHNNNTKKETLHRRPVAEIYRQPALVHTTSHTAAQRMGVDSSSADETTNQQSGQ